MRVQLVNGDIEEVPDTHTQYQVDGTGSLHIYERIRVDVEKTTEYYQTVREHKVNDIVYAPGIWKKVLP